MTVTVHFPRVGETEEIGKILGVPDVREATTLPRQERRAGLRSLYKELVLHPEHGSLDVERDVLKAAVNLLQKYREHE